MQLPTINTADWAHSTRDEADLFDQASGLGFGDVHFKIDQNTHLRAIIAIHNTRLGPALGGCRCVPYPSTRAALLDVLHLAQTMSYKAAIAGLPSGGGKAVIVRPSQVYDRELLFEAFGDFVEELGGRFISSVDSGTGVADMDVMARRTRYVRSTSATAASGGDPSPITALGVRYGIEAAVTFKHHRSDLSGIHVAIQGVGHVGYALARQLHKLGAALTICDSDKWAAERCADEFGAKIVSLEAIYTVPSDVFAPCALGGVINDETIHKLATGIVAGATNNPLSDLRHADILHNRGILYAPDYVINAGGLMKVLVQDPTALLKKVAGIHDTLLALFTQSESTNTSPLRLANRMAESVLYGPDAV